MVNNNLASSFKVSVIVPNYNHDKYLVKRINSILNQTHTNLECIILDDNSCDNSIKIIDEFITKDPRISFCKSKKNSGNTFTQWNKGLLLASSEFVWIAESDDIADPTLISALLKPLLNDSEVVLSFCQSYRMNETDDIIGSWIDFTANFNDSLFGNDFIMNGDEFIAKYLIYKNVVPNASAVLFRKSIFNKIGGADESLKTNGDWFTWIKMLTQGKIAYSKSHLNYFRSHSNSVIAKANKNINLSEYTYQFDYVLRKKVVQYFEEFNIPLSSKFKTVNSSFIQLDEGNKGLFLIKNGFYIKGISLVLKASFYPKFQTGFLKRAFKII